MTVAAFESLPIDGNIAPRWRVVPVLQREHTCRQHLIEKELAFHRIAKRHRMLRYSRVGRLKAQ